MKLYITIDPFTNRMKVYETLAEASKDCIRRNQKNINHPAFRLIEVNGKKVRHVGNLYRKFGMSFDSENCWKPGDFFP